MRSKAQGELLAAGSKAGLGIHGAPVTHLELPVGLHIGLVEGGDERAAQMAAFGRFMAQKICHIAAPVLVFIAIAAHPDCVRCAEDSGQIGGIPEIIRPPCGQLSLRQGRHEACADHESAANQDSMKTLLLHARTFARISPRLKGLEAVLNIVSLDDAGRFHDAFTSTELKTPPSVHLAFGNIDAFYSPSARDFMVTILKSPDFDWFQSAAAGIENPALASIGQKARLYTTNHTQSEAMAEWALWQALDFLRDGPGHRALQRQSKWMRLRAREISGSRWLIIGYGAIGQATGRRVSALGGYVTGLRRSQGLAEGAARIVPPEALMAELPEADVVLLCAPHTAETEGIANADFFAAMDSNALFMNLGRGALVDEEALVAALNAGRLAYAALDVTSTEPLPEDSPLWRHPLIAITPHDSSDTPGTLLRADETFLTNLALYLAGEEMHHLVPKEAFVPA